MHAHRYAHIAMGCELIYTQIGELTVVSANLDEFNVVDLLSLDDPGLLQPAILDHELARHGELHGSVQRSKAGSGELEAASWKRSQIEQ